MAWTPSIERPAPLWRSPRLPAAIAVVVLHLVLVFFILSSQSGPVPLPPLRHEVFIFFHPPAKPIRLPRKIETIAKMRTVAPPFRYAPSTSITVPPPPANTLELALFRCAPENLANLTPIERAHCGDAYSQHAFEAAIPGTLKEQSVDAARWQAAIVARNTPPTVPCVSLTKRESDRITLKTESAFQVDALCILRQLMDASDR